MLGLKALSMPLFILLIVGLVASPKFALYASEIKIEGRLVQGGWALLHLPAHSQLKLGHRQWQADAQGRALIGFSRDQSSPVKLIVTSPDKSSKEHQISIATKDYLIQRIDGLPQRFVTPDPAAQKRIRSDIALARAAREKILKHTYFLQGFIWPAEGIISGVWGSQRVLNGEARRPHFGVDIANDTGTPIKAPAAGEVTLVADMELSGGTVFVDHGYGLRSDFLHLDEIFVDVGDRVSQGQVIASMGATGRSTGPHLHWGMSWLDIRVDPEEVFQLPRRLQRGDKVINNHVILSNTP